MNVIEKMNLMELQTHGRILSNLKKEILEAEETGNKSAWLPLQTRFTTATQNALNEFGYPRVKALLDLINSGVYF